ncbi:MAG: VWA domain-containing protein [Gammaproteobacteria bacterium]
MRYKRREFSAFSLSFLDIMSCGFGAVVLLFLIIKHQAEVAVAAPEYDLSIEVDTLREEIAAATTRLDELKAQSDAQDVNIEGARTAVVAAKKKVDEARAGAPAAGTTGSEEIAALRAAIKRLEIEKRAVQAQINEKSRNVRTFVGEGNREYLTGIQLGGRRILILLDRSASMLDSSIVNIIRRRNMDDAAKRRSAKWRQALDTVDWISARFPPTSEYQIYTFNDAAEPALSGTRGRWLKVSDTAELNRAIDAVRTVVPEGGSSLERAFLAISQMKPRPDNVYLITDGLPTQGLKAPRGSTVTGRERLRLFEAAVERIPRGIPMNVILLPMEGDPMAPSAFWQIALYTQGSFLSPASDWP